MSILCDWEIKALSLGDKLIEPFGDHVVSEENNRKILSYGLGSYGYDIRLSSKQCLLFGEHLQVYVIQKALISQSQRMLIIF